MKEKSRRLWIAMGLITLLLLNSKSSIILAQGTTAFTFQGRLNTSTNAASGNFDMVFAVYDANIAGNLIAGPITNAGVSVNNGLFTVELDFGQGVFTGTNYWVQISLSTAGTGNFVTLYPRQQLTPTPYALSLVSPQATALCPSGSIIAFAGTNVPAGWLICDGSSVSRMNYNSLFAAIGTAWGSGDGSTTFNLPDLRGIFLRGVNGLRNDGFADPDVSTLRTNIFPGGNTGNAVGSYQEDMFASHNHAQNVTVGERLGIGGLGAVGDGNPPYGQMNATQNSGGNETRPKNAYVTYIIKY